MITEARVRSSKGEWERDVGIQNAKRAALRFEVSPLGLDYVNVPRLEQLLRATRGRVPVTDATAQLRERGILDEHGEFDERYVGRAVSGGRYLFDYAGASDPVHWMALARRLGDGGQFQDLNVAVGRGSAFLRELQGCLGVYTGHARGSSVHVPMRGDPDPIEVECRLDDGVIRFAVDPRYLLSRTAMSRIGRSSMYATYMYVRSVSVDPITQTFQMSATPLLMTQPAEMIAMSNEPYVVRD